MRKVSHLVQINNDPAAHKASRMHSASSEVDDVALMRELAFDANDVMLEPYDARALNTGKTPDFKLYKNGKLIGFCELKSPRDDDVFNSPKPGESSIRKNFLFYRKIGSHIRKASLQFDAVNKHHSLPNIMVFVSHSPEIERGDLHLTVSGLPAPDGRRIFMLGRKMQEQVHEAARKVDLFLWIDAEKRTLQHASVNDATHQRGALDLLGLDPEDPLEAHTTVEGEYPPV